MKVFKVIYVTHKGIKILGIQVIRRSPSTNAVWWKCEKYVMQKQMPSVIVARNTNI